MTTVAALVAELMHPAELHKLAPDALLDDLGLCAMTRHYTLPIAVEEAFSLPMIADHVIESWQTVSDIERTVEETNR